MASTVPGSRVKRNTDKKSRKGDSSDPLGASGPPHPPSYTGGAATIRWEDRTTGVHGEPPDEANGSTAPRLPTPTFLIIGAARSGTTYLARQLALHPDAVFSDPKEPHFLALHGHDITYRGPGDDATIGRFSVTGEAEWRALFGGSAASGTDRPQRGEGSVSTLYFPERAIPNIRRFCPEARMVVLLREPVARAHSAYEYWVARGWETLPFAEALDREDERIAEGYHHIWHYTRMGFYSEQLTAYYDAFPREQLLVLGYEDFMADKRAGLARVHEFLGLRHVVPDEVDDNINAGGSPRSKLMTAALRKARDVEPLRKAVLKTVPFAMREKIRGASSKASTMSPEAQARLEALYRDEVRSLGALLGDDAPGWARS